MGSEQRNTHKRPCTYSEKSKFTDTVYCCRLGANHLSPHDVRISVEEYERELVDLVSRTGAAETEAERLREFAICDAVIGAQYDRSTGLTDVSICENPRPCADHPPEQAFHLQGQVEGTEEALACEREEVKRQAARIAELEAALGPRLPCGCYAVEVEVGCDDSRYFCVHANAGTNPSSLPVTPEYEAWIETRNGGAR